MMTERMWLIHFEINNWNVNNQNRSYLFSSDDEDKHCSDETKLLLTDVAKILLWSRRRQWKDKILEKAA